MTEKKILMLDSPQRRSLPYSRFARFLHGTPLAQFSCRVGYRTSRESVCQMRLSRRHVGTSWEELKPLSVFSHAGQIAYARCMAKKNPSKHRSGPKAEDLFQPAIRKADLDKIRELLAAGHKPDAAAARQAVDECVRLAGTAAMKKRPWFGRMPTKKEKEKAATAAEIYYEIAKALLEAGAPVPELLCSAARCGHTQLALLLIRHGADVDYDPPMGTPLENAVRVGNLEVVRALIKAGADIHHQGIKGTLLNRAVEGNHLEVAKELINVGLDVNAQPKLGSTALLMAVTERKSEFVRLLLDAGANVNQKGTVVCGDFGEPETEGDGNFVVTTTRNPPVARDATPG